MSNNLLDRSLLFEICERTTSETAIDLESVDKNRNRDQPVGLDFLLEFIVDGLVEDDCVLGLVLDYYHPSVWMHGICDPRRSP